MVVRGRQIVGVGVRQAGGRTDRQVDRQTDSRTEGLIDIYIYIYIDKTDREAGR